MKTARLADDLTGVRHMVDAMRAYTHEFMNKLHVILGLLQIGEPERAQQYIMDTTRTQQEAVSRIMNQIKEPSVAALLVGKTSRANELGIRLTLDRESVLSAGTSWLSPDAWVTVLGNLIENAIEGLNQTRRGTKEVSVSISAWRTPAPASPPPCGAPSSSAEPPPRATAGGLGWRWYGR